MLDAVAAAVGNAQTIEALLYDYNGAQVVAVGAAAVSTAAFVTGATVAVLTSTTNCWYRVGGTAAVHAAGSDYLPANVKWKVKFAAGQTISVIQDTAGGFLSVTPVVNPNSTPLLLDINPSAAGAYSLRRLMNSYPGACVNVRRSSDNTFQDIGFTAAGDLDIPSFNAFIGGGNGFVRTWYDQSGNGNNATQATVASQPQLVLGVAPLGGRAALLFGDVSAFGLSVPSAASIDNPFANGGTFSAVVNQTSAPGTGDRMFDKVNVRFQLAAWSLKQAAATTTGSWSAPSVIGGANWAIQYSSASVANVPTINYNNVAQTLLAPTQPVGAITSDAGSALMIGNSAALTIGFPGHIAEMIFWKSLVGLPALYANQKNYWGTP